MLSWWPQHQLLKHTQPLIPLSTVRRPTTAYRRKTTHSQLCEERKDNRVTIPNKRWNTVQVQPHSRFFIGLSVAKTTQQQSPKDLCCLSNQELMQNQGESTTQTHDETMATLHSLKTREKSDSQSWTKEGHKHRPQSDEETTRTLHSLETGEKKKNS